VTKTTCCVALVTNIQPSNPLIHLQTCLRLLNYNGLTNEVTSQQDEVDFLFDDIQSIWAC
jgi:hypothetical protein